MEIEPEPEVKDYAEKEEMEEREPVEEFEEENEVRFASSAKKEEVGEPQRSMAEQEERPRMKRSGSEETREE